jgi:hypothetical protein
LARRSDEKMMPILRVKIIYAVAAAPIVMLLMLRQAMSESECNFRKVAMDFVAAKYPSFNVAGSKLVASRGNDFWEVTWELPDGTLGGVPIVHIDTRSCAVIRAMHSQ